MVKNKAENKKKKRFLNVLSTKGLMILAAISIMALSTIFIAGCGKQGSADINTYVGYDGYIWTGDIRTNLKVTDIALRENVVENTIGIEGMMSNYFVGRYVDLRQKTIALMANYKPNIQATQYSGVKVTQIKVVVEEAGKLFIGTAKVADLVNARKKGEDYNYVINPVDYIVDAGLNTINLNLEVGNDDTIVLGGQNSVGIYVLQGIPVNDQHGNFTYINKEPNNDLLVKNGNYDDTLAIQVSAQATKFEYKEIISDSKADFTNVCNFTKGTIYDNKSGPYTYKKLDHYAGYKIDKFGIPLYSIQDCTKESKFTFYIIKQNTVPNGSYNTNYVSKYELKIPANTFNSNQVNQWYYFDLSGLNIRLSSDETIAFFDNSDSVFPCYLTGNGATKYQFYSNAKNGDAGTASIYFDIQYIDKCGFSFDQHLINLEEKERYAKMINELSEILKGKNFSILGDSISTFSGYSNNASNTNNTIGSNDIYYNGSNYITDVNQTWWKQVANKTQMNVLVNNSYSGDKLSTKGQTRCVQLHDNTGENAGTNPDVIAVYLGINDYNDNLIAGSYETINWQTLIVKNQEGIYSYGIPKTFAEYYAVMLHKLTSTYNQKMYVEEKDVTQQTTKADIFLFTHVPNDKNSRPISDLLTYNKIIEKLAERYNCTIVDLYNDSGITNNNKSEYMGDSDALHPNIDGMKLIADCFWDVLYNKYAINANK